MLSKSLAVLIAGSIAFSIGEISRTISTNLTAHLASSAADNVLDGGAGVDTVSYRDTNGVTVDLSLTTAQNTGLGNDTLVNFENVLTGSGNDTITGNAGDNVFYEGGGNDIYDGGAGSDTVDYSAATSAVIVNLNTTTAQTTGSFGGSDTLRNIENVIGSTALSNTLRGGDMTANRLVGGAAADARVRVEAKGPEPATCA